MSDNTVKQVFMVDGRTFESKAEAQDYVRRPKVVEALKTFISDNDNLINWLVENQETVEMAAEIGTIKRVTKSETAKLQKGVDRLKEIYEADKDANKALAFLVENADQVVVSFRHPKTTRMNDEQKQSAALEALTAATGNEKLAQFIVSNEEKILEAYGAGKPKREVNPAAAAGLAEYRARMAAEKATRESQADTAPAPAADAAAA